MKTNKNFYKDYETDYSMVVSSDEEDKKNNYENKIKEWSEASEEKKERKKLKWRIALLNKKNIQNTSSENFYEDFNLDIKEKKKLTYKEKRQEKKRKYKAKKKEEQKKKNIKNINFNECKDFLESKKTSLYEEPACEKKNFIKQEDFNILMYSNSYDEIINNFIQDKKQLEEKNHNKKKEKRKNYWFGFC